MATAPTPRPDAFSNRILTNDLLYHSIFDDLSPAGLLRLSRTCRTAHASVNAYIASTFNINKLLLRYFPDPIAFRSLQARTAMLISGSTALQFFSRLIYPDSYLDLYIHGGYREEIGRWLLAQSYVYCPNRVQDPDFDTEAKKKQHRPDLPTHYSTAETMSVLTFKKSPSIDAETELTVQVKVSFSRSPLMQTIFRFHSSMCHHSRTPASGLTSHVSRRHERDRVGPRILPIPSRHARIPPRVLLLALAVHTRSEVRRQVYRPWLAF